MIRLNFVLLLLILVWPPDALAWGRNGHRLIAKLAEAQLTPQARSAIDSLLSGEPDPTLAGVASWADELRNSDPDLGKRSAPWHYIDLGEHDCRYVKQRDCPDGNCLVEALLQQSAILADTSRDHAARLQALKFVVHFVGDAHQPLHSGYHRDRGGNQFQINFRGKGSNLHSFWDSGMLASAGLDEAAMLQHLRSIPVQAHAPTTLLPPPARQWVEQSCQVVTQPGFYPAHAKISEDYVAQWRPVAEQRLVLAGAHLAKLLNATFETGGR